MQVNVICSIKHNMVVYNVQIKKFPGKFTKTGTLVRMNTLRFVSEYD